jgi:hypothetical protein
MSETTWRPSLANTTPGGVVSLRRQPLHLCEMTTKRAPFAGTVTTPEPSSQEEVQRRVSVAIGKASYSWPPSWLFPILPNEGNEKLVSSFIFR